MPRVNMKFGAPRKFYFISIESVFQKITTKACITHEDIVSRQQWAVLHIFWGFCCVLGT